MKPEAIAFRNAIEDYPGGLAVFARNVGEASNTVCNWKSRGCPASKAKLVAKVAGTTVQKLRPLDWRDYWPNDRGARG